MSAQWYEIVEDSSDLLQGDILLGCPVIRMSADAKAAELVEINAAVLTQSCDLENDKVDDVLLARIFSWREVLESRGDRDGSRLRKKFASNEFANLRVLESHDHGPSLPPSLVDFRHLHTVPFAVVQRHAVESGRRLRLNSPFREMIAQAFAAFISRVALPEAPQSFFSAPLEG